MAHGQYIVIEKIELKIIDECLEKMTETNFSDKIDGFIGNGEFENNIKNGMIIVTMLKTYLDTSINYICNNSNSEIKYNIFETIKELYKGKTKALEILEKKTEYVTFKEMNNIRNNFIHFDNNYLGESTGIPLNSNKKNKIISEEKESNFIIEKGLYQYFIKTKMIEVVRNIEKLVEDIAKEFGFIINEECDVFMADGKDNKISYLIKGNNNE